jgi:carboxymethylenebutenolidase
MSAQVTRENIDLTGTGLPGTSATLRGVLMRPPTEGPHPGLVVAFEAFGVDDEMIRHSARMAGAGYLTLMPDLYSDGGPRRCMRSTFQSFVTGRGRAVQDLLAARQWLLDSPECTGKVGIIGFCMGGGFAMVVANRGFDAASVNYGVLPGDLDAAFTGACPVVASYGAKDFSLPGAAGKIEVALGRAGVPHDVKEYPDAGHRFFNTTNTGPGPLSMVMRFIPGFGPDPDAAADAWGRIDAFFDEHLAGGSTAAT